MPTVLNDGPYRFYFYSNEGTEPPHIHVDRDSHSARFWLDPLGVARSVGFRPAELRHLASIVMSHRLDFLEAWNGYFGTGGR